MTSIQPSSILSFAVFVPVFSFPTQLTKVRSEVSFAAEDPWNGNRPGQFTLDAYAVTLRGVKSVPASTRESWWFGSFHRALRSETDGVTRFLPESLIELWLTRQVSTAELPALLKQIEPSLKKRDYKPILRGMRMKIFGVFEVICCSLLVIIAFIAVVAGHAPLLLAAVIVLAVAGVCWTFLYLVYFKMLFRRKQQMRWLLEHIRVGSPAAEKEIFQMIEPLTPPKQPQPPRAPLISPQPMPLQTIVRNTKLGNTGLGNTGLEGNDPPGGPAEFRFESIMDVPDVMEPAMEPRLRKAFPELKWENHAENWGKVRILGTSRESPERVVVSIVRKESAGPFKLGITVSAQDQSGALKVHDQFVERLKGALLGWSQFHLPKFKTRPPSGVDIDLEEIVDLVFPLERPQIRLLGTNADILISQNLLEALSTNGEILDSRAKEPKKYPGSNDEESRLAGMRGARARLILGKAVPAGPDKDLEMELATERQAQYLIGELLENGLAQVVLKGPGGRSSSCPRVAVHYFGSRMAPTAGFGFISYSAASVETGNGGEFLHLDWWRS